MGRKVSKPIMAKCGLCNRRFNLAKYGSCPVDHKRRLETRGREGCNPGVWLGVVVVEFGPWGTNQR